MARKLNMFGRFARNKDGATAIEAAMVFPLVIMSIFALFHTAIFFFSTHQAQRASEQVGREVRMMSLPSQAQIQTALAARLEKPVGGTYKLNVIRINEFGGTFADIRISYEYKMPIPFLDKHTFRSESGTRVLLRNLS